MDSKRKLCVHPGVEGTPQAADNGAVISVWVVTGAEVE